MLLLQFVVYWDEEVGVSPYGFEILLFHGRNRQEAFNNADPILQRKAESPDNLRWLGDYRNGETFDLN